jgi:hypothetical protein
MDNIAGIPYTTAEFDETGTLQNNPQVPPGTTDLIVISHGWNNNPEAAERLYTALMTNFANVTKNDARLKGRKLAILGIIWPSKQWDLAITNRGATTVDQGGAAGVDPVEKPKEREAMLAAIDRASAVFDEPAEHEKLAKLRALVPDLDDEAKQAEFVRTVRELVNASTLGDLATSDEDASAVFFKGNPQDIFEKAKQKAPTSTRDEHIKVDSPAELKPVGEGVGEAASFGSFFSGLTNAVTNLMNLGTYFKMKIRAGTVGAKGVAPLIDRLADKVERIHLVGHSFGGRLVTATAMASTTPKLQSMSLLQAAFSHHGFSRIRSGYFRKVAKDQETPAGKCRVAGPVLITHSKYDRAVGVAYPIASRISQDQSTALQTGGPEDAFGGIGSNGAVKMDTGEVIGEVNRLGAVGTDYAFKPGKLHNLNGDDYIVDKSNPKADAHGFVYVPEVAWAISRAIVT